MFLENKLPSLSGGADRSSKLALITHHSFYSSFPGAPAKNTHGASHYFRLFGQPHRTAPLALASIPQAT